MVSDSYLIPHRLHELFGITLRLCRTRLGLFFLIVAIPFLPLTVLQILVLTSRNAQQLLTLAQGSLIATCVDALIIVAASQVYSQQPASLRSTYGRLGHRYGVLIIAFLLQGLLILVPSAMVWSVIAGVTKQAVIPQAASFGTMIPLLIIGIPIVICIVRFYLVTAVAMLERHGPGTTLRRSWELTRGAFWRTLLVVVTSALLGGLVAGTPATLMAMLLPTRTSVLAQWSYAISTTLLSQIALFLVWTLQAILSTVLYHDLVARVPQSNAG
jgi:hypothetical protein